MITFFGSKRPCQTQSWVLADLRIICPSTINALHSDPFRTGLHSDPPPVRVVTVWNMVDHGFDVQVRPCPAPQPTTPRPPVARASRARAMNVARVPRPLVTPGAG